MNAKIRKVYYKANHIYAGSTLSVTSVMEKLKNISLGFVAILIWALLVDFVIGLAGLYGHPFKFDGDHITLKYFMSACILAPIWEELAFRYAPGKYIMISNPEALWPVAILSSVVFGWLHGGAGGVILQGMMGFIFFVVYVKNKFSITSSIILHSSWNLFVGIFM